MKRLTEVCREQTGLNGVQIELLKQVVACFPFLADLAHACVRLYVLSRDGKDYILAAQEMPHTIYLPPEQAGLGSRRRVQEEPLVQETFRTGKGVHGKREWIYGSMMDMRTLPVEDGGQILAVASLETDFVQPQMEGYDHIMKTVAVLLQNARKALDTEMYRHLRTGDGILIADQHNRIVFANPAAVRIYRVLGVGSLMGCHLFDRQLTRHITRETVVKSRPWEKEIEVGGLILLQRSLSIKEGGNLLRQVVILSDLTEIRQKDKEIRIKSAVIQEIHHRVKNNLQTIASLLRLQARRSSSPEVKAALEESVNRILSISVVHEFLSQQRDEGIDVAEVAKNLFEMVAQKMVDETFQLETKISGPALVLPSKYASSLALVLNELVINAIEHAFEGRTAGRIGLDMREDGAEYLLDLYDDGNGLPEGFSPESTRSLGLQIVRTLVEGDLGGEFALVCQAGTHAKIRMPKEPVGEQEERN